MKVEARLKELGLNLPQPLRLPPGARLPFAMVRVREGHAYVSGHGPQRPDGGLIAPGKVGADLSVDQAYQAARLVGLAMIGSLKAVLADLDRITAWLRVFGMVNSAPGFTAQSAVINGCSDLLIEVFGPEVGQHARCAVGMFELPFGLPVEIEAELLVE